MAGRVESLGNNVTRFQEGDEVFGWCSSAYAKYVAVSQDAMTPKPVNLTVEQVAAVPVSAFTALQGLRDKGALQPGQKVLITGASDGVGTFAIQLAKAYGAEVTAVRSTRSVDLVRSIGADHASAYTLEDFAQSGQRYDLMLEHLRQPVVAGLPARARAKRDAGVRWRDRRSLIHGHGSLAPGAPAITACEPEDAPLGTHRQ